MPPPIPLGTSKSAERYLGQSTVAGLPDPTTVPAGGYYEMTDAGTAHAITWAIGDKAISNGTSYAKRLVPVAKVVDGGTGANNAGDASLPGLLNFYPRELADARHLSKAITNAVVLDGVASVLSNPDASGLLAGGDGTHNNFLYVLALIWIDDVANGFPICGRYDNAKREWFFSVKNDGHLFFRAFDDSESQVVSVTANSRALVSRRWAVAELIFNGASGSAAMDGVTLKVNGIECTVDRVNDASFVAMENKAGSFRVGEDNNGGAHAKGMIAGLLVGSADLGINEVPDLTVLPEYQWAGPSLLSIDFSGDALDGFTAVAGSVSATETVASDANNLQFTCGSGSGNHRLNKSITPLQIGQRYGLWLDCNIPAGQSHIDQLRVTLGQSANLQTIGSFTTADGAWHSLYLEFTAQYASDVVYLYGSDGGTTNFTDPGEDDTFAIRPTAGRPFIQPVGVWASYQGRNVKSDGGVEDESSNELDLVATSASRLFEPKAQKSGSFTPQLYFGSNLQTVGVASGYWWGDAIHEKLIRFLIDIESPAAVSDVGNVIVQGMPFVSVNDATKQFPVEIIVTAVTGLTGSHKALIISNTDDIYIYQTSASGVTPLTNSDLTTATKIRISGFYEIA